MNVNALNPSELACVLAAGRLAKAAAVLGVGDDSLHRTRGLALEKLVVAALLEVGVPPESIRRNVSVSEKRADMDILVHGKGEVFGIQCKASLAERWRQSDRDCLVASDYYGRSGVRFKSALVTISERLAWSSRDTGKHQRVQAWLLSDNLQVVGTWNTLAIAHLLWQAKRLGSTYVGA